MIEGGCFCNKTRYTIEDGDYPIVNCHCTICRKTSAAPFVTWAVVPKTALTLSGRVPGLLQSSEQGERQFCTECGTPLTFCEKGRPEYIDVTVGSFDAPEAFRPTRAVFEDTKLPWLGTTE